MTPVYDYYGFESKLMEKCLSENSQRYAKQQMPRLFYTLHLIECFFPKAKSKVYILDIGPFLPFTLTFKETLGDLFDKTVTISVVELPNGEKLQSSSEIQFVFCNIEQEPPNLNPNCFDLVLMSGILEHFIKDPYYALCQAHRLLTENGTLILMVPNVASLRNRVKLAFGGNIYDRYSRESVYGRHNREYNVTEVKELVRTSGFEVMHCYTKSLEPHKSMEAIHKRALRRAYSLFVKSLIRSGLNLGDGIYCVARKKATVQKFPEWLYRYSYGLQSMLK